MQPHASPDQVIKVIKFVKELLARAKQENTSSKRTVQNLKEVNSSLVEILLNSTVLKVLRSIKQMRLVDTQMTKTWMPIGADCKYTPEGPGQWLSVPQTIYNFFNYFIYEI